MNCFEYLKYLLGFDQCMANSILDSYLLCETYFNIQKYGIFVISNN